MQCESCGFKFTNPIPLDDQLAKYYDSQEYISHSAVKSGWINKIYHQVRKFTIGKKVGLVKKYFKKGKLLDIGCGTGEFLHALSKRNFQVKGIEPNDSARKYAIENYGLHVYKENELKNFDHNIFKIITLWHVLEHVYNLNARIEQIKDLLAKDGILIVALPNSDSWDAKHYKEFWAAYDCPRHLYHFNQKSVKEIFSKHGFEIVKMKPMIFDAFYISMLSEKYKTGRSNLIKSILHGIRSNLYALFNNKNYSSIIYILKSNIN
jgi:2-polyprenyl-3-methyl-5-hydroxy-6-metoxy-1,4-benzoquinol methylase